ncbi:MAG: hypothetical protein HGA85_05075 [Nanoarchaeota archaeon]|nr:hypothetical protein [Nanoarchaeota archaeon]
MVLRSQLPTAATISTESVGKKKKGSILAFQTEMQEEDFLSEDNYRKKLESYFIASIDAGFLSAYPKKNGNKIVALPEYVGTWLIISGEDKGILSKKTSDEVLKAIILRNPFGFILRLLSPGTIDKSIKNWVIKAAFNLKAEKMASVFHQVMSGLSSKYGVMIVAGSLVVPNPTIEKSSLKTSPGKLYNTSIVYNADGTPDTKVTRKLHPIDEELGFSACGIGKDLHVYETPLGKMLLLICADGWYQEHYKKADFCIVPSNLTPDTLYDAPFTGFGLTPMPREIDAQDFGKITGAEARVKYGPVGQAIKAKMPMALELEEQGGFFDIHAKCRSALLLGKKIRRFLPGPRVIEIRV